MRVFCFLSLFCSFINILFPLRLLFIICGGEKIFSVLVQDLIPSTYCVMLLLPAEGKLFVRLY